MTMTLHAATQRNQPAQRFPNTHGRSTGHRMPAVPVIDYDYLEEMQEDAELELLRYQAKRGRPLRADPDYAG